MDMKNYLRTQITLYEEDKNYPIWRRQERRSKYAVQLASWQLRSNSPKTSVRPSVRLSFRHTFFTMFPSSYHHEIFRNYYQWQKWRPCKRSRSKVKVTEVNTQLNRFRTVTPVWIHIWWWNDAYSFMKLRRGALLFFKVICQILRSHGSKKHSIWPRLGVSGL